jgi:hypothetical protein
MSPTGLPNGVAILATRRESCQNDNSLTSLPFCWDQLSRDMCTCADSKTQMATEFNYIVGVTKKIGHIVILAPVAKTSFVNKKNDNSY